jgi:CofD-related protein of GAK system
MTKVQISRTATIPNPFVVRRYQKSPELGPRLVFFSGGSALNGLSRELKQYTHNSIHFVSPFDSGGSSAKLRQAFDMPAIGDLRSRLMALADETVLGHPEIVQLFSTRFPVDAEQSSLKQRLTSMLSGEDALVAAIAEPMRKLICAYLSEFFAKMPADFDLRGASIGNLIITGGYLSNHRDLDTIVFQFSQLVNALGEVRTITNDNFHLVAQLSNEQTLIGQHLITGKEVAPINAAVKDLSLSLSATTLTPAHSKLGLPNQQAIAQADLICYPPGSFYTSLIANLLPEGVGKAIANNGCPKVYVPNLAADPEQLGMSLEDAIKQILIYAGKDFAGQAKASDLLNYVMVDSKQGNYLGGIPTEYLKQQGITLIDVKLMNKASDKSYDEKRLVAALLSLT